MVKNVFFFCLPLIPIFIIILVLMFLTLNYSGNNITYALDNIGTIINRIKKGNLGFNIASLSNDNIGIIVKNLEELLIYYKNNLLKVKKSSFDVTGFQNKLEEHYIELDSSMKEQVSLIKNCLNRYEEVNNMIMKLLINVSETKSILDQAQAFSNTSTVMINEMVSDINKIAETGEEINLITELINDISERTRLLSVNSAIEASRAGDVGKGFNIVSTEIKKLASQSKDASVKIADLIKINDNRIKTGVARTQEVFDLLNNVNSNIKNISDLVEQITSLINSKKDDYSEYKRLNNIYFKLSEQNSQKMANIKKLKALSSSELNNILDVVKYFDTLNDEHEEVSGSGIVTSVKNDKKLANVRAITTYKE